MAAAEARSALITAGEPQLRPHPRPCQQQPAPCPRQRPTSAPAQRELPGAAGLALEAGKLLALERLRRGAARGFTSGPAAAGLAASPCLLAPAASQGLAFSTQVCGQSFLARHSQVDARSFASHGRVQRSLLRVKEFLDGGITHVWFSFPVRTGLNSNFMSFGLMAMLPA